MTQSIGFSDLINRHTPESGFTHWDFDNSKLLELVQAGFSHAKPGYRDGVLIVPVEPEGFHCPTVTLELDDVLWGGFKVRAEGEEPRKYMRVVRPEGVKSPAVAVDAILYRADVLEEGDERSTDCAWEIITVNSRMTEEEEPMRPDTLMANHFGASGGTATHMSPEEFEKALCESFHYWKDKGSIQPIRNP